MSEPTVHEDRDGGVCVLTLDDDETRNALSPRMRELMMEAYARSLHDPSVRCIVITGRGGNFCAGSDISRMLEQDVAARVERMARFQRFVLDWIDAPKPVIVAIEGSAAGGGLSMSLAADWSVAAEDAYFVPGWIKIGLAPDVATVWMLSRVMGRKRALDWLVLGDRLRGPEALQEGIVSETCAPGQALAAAIEKGKQLCGLPPEALAVTKRLFRLALSSHPSDFVLGELYAEGYLFHGHEHSEGVRAFLEKRSPTWLESE